MFGLKCPLCQDPRGLFKRMCSECALLFEVLQAELGRVGFSQMLDRLIATGVPKAKIKRFLETDSEGRGSLLDQLTAQLTNNLAEGMGVKEANLSSVDVKRIRENPNTGVATKPID